MRSTTLLVVTLTVCACSSSSAAGGAGATGGTSGAAGGAGGSSGRAGSGGVGAGGSGAAAGAGGSVPSPIAASRAVDWTKAGLPAQLPDGETTANPWTPPARSTVCATIEPEGTPSSPVAPDDVQAAIASCPAGQVVQLGAGAFYFNAGITIASNANQVNSVTLRGAGADQTKVYFIGSGGIALSQTYAGSAEWTGGYSRGATELTLSSVSDLVKGQTLLELSECGTGFSGSDCSNSTDSQVDNGGEWICGGDGPWCSHGGTGNEGGRWQSQVVLVTGWTGTGPYNVSISPGLYMDNWSAANSPKVDVFHRPISGIGLEDLSVDETQSGGDIFMSGCYGCWARGLRVVGGAGVGVSASKNVLVANNYLVDWQQHNGYGVTVSMSYSVSDALIINNITSKQDSLAADGGTEGDVFAYNDQEGAATPTPHNEVYSMFMHTGGTAYMLAEGNESVEWMDDNIHGTHDFTTLFRNRLSGRAGVYNGGNAAVFLGNGTRFTNIIGNVLGTRGFNLNYQSVPTAGAGFPIYYFGFGATLGSQGGVPRDVTVASTTLRWMNYDTVTQSITKNASEVPSDLNAAVGYQEQIGTGDGSATTFKGTLAHSCFNGSNDMVYDRKDGLYAYDDGSGTLTGKSASGGSITCPGGAVNVTFTTAPAMGSPIYVNYLHQTTRPSAYRNPLPPSALPPSLFIPVAAHASGGTGLSWWKVCTDYPACSKFSVPPFPPIGPDVTGGNGPGGHAHDIPAHLAFKNLPVDTSYQVAYSVAGVTCSGGTATITLKTALSSTPIGEFTVTGVSPSGYDGRFDMTDSTTTTVSYRLAHCPASAGTSGSLSYPDVRQFNQAVYQADTGS